GSFRLSPYLRRRARASRPTAASARAAPGAGIWSPPLDEGAGLGDTAAACTAPGVVEAGGGLADVDEVSVEGRGEEETGVGDATGVTSGVGVVSAGVGSVGVGVASGVVSAGGSVVPLVVALTSGAGVVALGSAVAFSVTLAGGVGAVALVALVVALTGGAEVPPVAGGVGSAHA